MTMTTCPSNLIQQPPTPPRNGAGMEMTKPSDAQRRTWNDFISLDLDRVIDWVQDYLDPDDVFSDDELREWARACDPEAVFTDEQLAKWALANGYTEEEK